MFLWLLFCTVRLRRCTLNTKEQPLNYYLITCIIFEEASFADKNTVNFFFFCFWFLDLKAVLHHFYSSSFTFYQGLQSKFLWALCKSREERWIQPQTWNGMFVKWLQFMSTRIVNRIVSTENPSVAELREILLMHIIDTAWIFNVFQLKVNECGRENCFPLPCMLEKLSLWKLKYSGGSVGSIIFFYEGYNWLNILLLLKWPVFLKYI